MGTSPKTPHVAPREQNTKGFFVRTGPDLVVGRGRVVVVVVGVVDFVDQGGILVVTIAVGSGVATSILFVTDFGVVATS